MTSLFNTGFTFVSSGERKFQNNVGEPPPLFPLLINCILSTSFRLQKGDGVK